MANSYNAASPLDVLICNRALDMVHARNIATLDSTLTMEEEQKCANIYEQTRDLLLKEYRWNFAIRTATVLNYASAGVSPAVNSIPLFGTEYSYASSLPPECLRVLELPEFANDKWRIQASGATKYLLCDVNTDDDDLEVNYIKKVQESALFDTHFIEILQLRLASKLAFSIADSSSGGADFYQMEKVEVKKAYRLDAIEDAEFDDESNDEDQDDWAKAGR